MFLAFAASFLFSSVKHICDFLSFSSYKEYIELVSFKLEEVLRIPVLMLVILSREVWSRFLVSCKCELTDFIDLMASEGSTWLKSDFFEYSHYYFFIYLLYVYQFIYFQ